jgi:hypothetical protein
MSRSIDELFTQFKGATCNESKYYLFEVCAEDVTIENANISKLIEYFNDSDKLPAIKLIKISNITSCILIDILNKCNSVEYRYKICIYLLSYVSTFDSLEHKIKIINLFRSGNLTLNEEHKTRLVHIGDLIKDIKIVKNYESDLNSPPSYEIGNDNDNDNSHVPIQDLIAYFDETTAVAMFKLVKISNITSHTLIEILCKCKSFQYRYEIFTYLLSYVYRFYSLEHKMKIIKLFEYDYHHESKHLWPHDHIEMENRKTIFLRVVDQLKHIKLVENYESKLTPPPSYNIANNISCTSVQNNDPISYSLVQK